MNKVTVECRENTSGLLSPTSTKNENTNYSATLEGRMPYSPLAWSPPDDGLATLH